MAVVAGTSPGNEIHDVEQVTKGARESVQFPDHDTVAFTQEVDHPVKLGPIPATARGVLREDSVNTGAPQGFKLSRRFRRSAVDTRAYPIIIFRPPLPQPHRSSSGATEEDYRPRATLQARGIRSFRIGSSRGLRHSFEEFLEDSIGEGLNCTNAQVL